MNINYFLIEANRFKLENYKRIPLNYILELVNYIYDGKPTASLTKKFTKGSIEENGKKYFYFNWDEDNKVYSKPYSIINTQKYLATMANNVIVKQIYIASFTNPAYKELAFVMFLLGVVNTEDYLTMNRDISYIVSRFEIKYSRVSQVVNRGILISVNDYISLMGIYYKNATNGVRYGINPMDFIWNAYTKYELNKYSNSSIGILVDSLRKVVGVRKGLPNLSDSDIKKYRNELMIVSEFTELSDEEKRILLQQAKFMESEICEDIVSTDSFIEINDKGAYSVKVG